jgi:hypothetical protein
MTPKEELYKTCKILMNVTSAVSTNIQLHNQVSDCPESAMLDYSFCIKKTMEQLKTVDWKILRRNKRQDLIDYLGFVPWSANSDLLLMPTALWFIVPIGSFLFCAQEPNCIQKFKKVHEFLPDHRNGLAFYGIIKKED